MGAGGWDLIWPPKPQASRWPLQRPLVAKTDHLAWRSLNNHGSLDPLIFWKAGQTCTTWLLLRAAPGPKQGTDPREVVCHFNRQPSKDGQRLTPTCANCQPPTREHSGGNAPLISGFHRCGGEKLLLWAERDGFQGFLHFWCQPLTTARCARASCGVVSDGGSGAGRGAHTDTGICHWRHMMEVSRLSPKEHGASRK